MRSPEHCVFCLAADLRDWRMAYFHINRLMIPIKNTVPQMSPGTNAACMAVRHSCRIKRSIIGTGIRRGEAPTSRDDEFRARARARAHKPPTTYLVGDLQHDRLVLLKFVHVGYRARHLILHRSHETVMLVICCERRDFTRIHEGRNLSRSRAREPLFAYTTYLHPTCPLAWFCKESRWSDIVLPLSPDIRPWRSRRNYIGYRDRCHLRSLTTRSRCRDSTNRPPLSRCI